MSRWLWPTVVIATLAAAFAADRLLWPDRVAIELYAIPVLLAVKDWPPQTVMGVTIGSLAVATYDLYRAGHVTLYAEVGLAALLVLGLLATLYTVRREEYRRRIEQQQRVISSVERLRQPLTVILGYSQVLEARLPSEAILAKAAANVHRAGLDLRCMLDEIMQRYVPS